MNVRDIDGHPEWVLEDFTRFRAAGWWVVRDRDTDAIVGESETARGAIAQATSRADQVSELTTLRAQLNGAGEELVSLRSRLVAIIEAAQYAVGTLEAYAPNSPALDKLNAALAEYPAALVAEAKRGREAERLLEALVDWQGIDHQTTCRAVRTENDEDCKCERRELADDVNEFFRPPMRSGERP